MNTRLRPETVISFMRSEFPSFDSIVDVDDGVYDALGDFAIYLRNGISNNSLSDVEMGKAFKIMNALAAEKDLEVQNMLVVGILEILTDDKRVSDVVRRGLKDDALRLFERTLKGWCDK